MPISWRRENDGFIMTHILKTETFSQQIEHSGGVIVLPLTPLFSFVTFHLKRFNTLYDFEKNISILKTTVYFSNSFLKLHDPKKVNWNWRLTFRVYPVIKSLWRLCPRIVCEKCTWLLNRLEYFDKILQTHWYWNCNMIFVIRRGIAERQILKKWN